MPNKRKRTGNNKYFRQNKINLTQVNVITYLTKSIEIEGVTNNENPSLRL